MQIFKTAERAKEIVSVGRIQAVIARCGLWWKNGSENPQNKDQGMQTCGWGRSWPLGYPGLWEIQSLGLEFYRLDQV